MRCATIALAALLAAACISAARGEAAVTASDIIASQDALWNERGLGFVTMNSQAELDLTRFIAANILDSCQYVVANRTAPPPSAPEIAAAALPVRPTPAQVTAAIAKVLAAGFNFGSSTQQALLGSLGDPKLWKYSRIDRSDSRVALYRVPNSPKCTCVFIHGCNHDNFDWFYKSPKCPTCRGLPEEVSHCKQCLANGCAVFVPRSLAPEGPGVPGGKVKLRRCFSSGKNEAIGYQNDQFSTLDIIEDFLKANRLFNLPMYMFGISAGGAFAAKFPRIVDLKKSKIRFEGLVSEANMFELKTWGVLDRSLTKFIMPIPPFVFYNMSRDPRTSGYMADAARVFRANNKPYGIVNVPVRVVDAQFMFNRSLYINNDQSKRIYDALVFIGLVDPKTNLIKRNLDPRRKTAWIKALYARLPWLSPKSPYYNLVADESQIYQALNLAYNQHEIVSDYVRATLEWFKTGGKANLDALVQQYDLNNNIRCLTEKRPGCTGTRRGLF